MKLNTQAFLQVSVALCALVSVSRAQPPGNSHRKRQVAPHTVSAEPLPDQLSQASGQLGPTAALQAHSKFFQDFFSVQLSPYKIEFGHVCEDPNRWEQRYERKDYKNHRDQGKVRWGDKNGGYGEHYWDFNHAGHGGHDHDEHDDHDDSHDEGSDSLNDYEEYQEPDSSRKKRNPKSALETIPTTPSATLQKQPTLYLDEATGRIVDRNTGRLYMLQPVN